MLLGLTMSYYESQAVRGMCNYDFIHFKVEKVRKLNYHINMLLDMLTSDALSLRLDCDDINTCHVFLTKPS